MPLFSQKGNRLAPIREVKIDLEKDIQKLTEQNIEDVFGLRFVRTEFALNNFRIDTLAFDEELNSFVIIEYKRGSSFSVVDQGFAYLSLMLNNKADFILEYNENSTKTIKRDDIDWSQSRVIFVANSFTTYQKEAISFRDLRFELWEAKKYDNDTILYNQIKADQVNESIKTVTKSKVVENVSQEIKNYTIDDHFQGRYAAMRDVYDDLSVRLQELDERIIISPQKKYIGFKLGKSVVVAIKSYTSKLELELNRVRPQDMKDPENNVRYIEGSMEKWNKHLSSYAITDQNQIDYAVFLAKQVYDKFDW